MEYLEIVDEENNLTGKTEERDIVHAKGLWHREIAVWIMNEKGEVLLQKRSPNKKQGANNWSTSCAGHIDIGEEPIKSAIREIREELGIPVKEDDLKHLFTAKNKRVLTNSFNNIFCYLYFLKVNTPIEEFTIDTEEVSKIKYIPFEEFEQLVKDKPANAPFTAREYMPAIVEELRKNI